MCVATNAGDDDVQHNTVVDCRCRADKSSPAVDFDDPKLKTKLAKALQVQGKALGFTFSREECEEALDAAAMDINKAADMLVAKVTATDAAAGFPSDKASTTSSIASTHQSSPLSAAPSSPAPPPSASKVTRAPSRSSAVVASSPSDAFVDVSAAAPPATVAACNSMLDSLKHAAIGATNEIMKGFGCSTLQATAETVNHLGSPYVTEVLRVVHALNASLVAMSPGPAEDGLPERAILPQQQLVHQLDFQIVKALLQASSSVLRASAELNGLLFNDAGNVQLPPAGKSAACVAFSGTTGTVLAMLALESCFTVILILAAPHIDKLVQEDDYVDAAVKFLKHYVTSFVAPVYNPNDAAWKDGDRQRVDKLADLDEPEDDDEVEDAPVKSSAGSVKKYVSLRGSARKRLLATLRPLGDTLHRFVALMQTLELRDTHIDSLASVAMQLATHCSWEIKGRHPSSSTERSLECTVQLASMSLLQFVFSRYKDKRASLLRDLAVHTVVVGSLKTSSRSLSLRSTTSRPYAQRRAGEASATDAKAAMSADLEQTFSTNVFPFSALICHLLHSAVELPVRSDVTIPVSPATPQKPASGKKGKPPKAPLTPGDVAGSPEITKQASANAFGAVHQLAVYFVRLVMSWVCERVAGGTGTVALPSGSFEDDTDAKLVVKRLCIDMLTLVDLPEWPVASTLLIYLLHSMVDLLPKQQQSATVAATPDKSARGLAPLCIGVLGLVIARTTTTRAYAKSHVLSMPSASASLMDVELSASTESAPETDNGEAGGATATEAEPHCKMCEDGVVVGSMMIACDECNQWYHGECVGILELEAQALQYWTCDECRMRDQLKGVQEKVALLASRLEIEQSVGFGAPSSQSRNKEDRLRLKRQLLINFLTTSAYEDAFVRMGRRFLLAKWAHERNAEGDAVGREYFASQWLLPHRSITKNPVTLTAQNSLRVSLELLMSEPVFTKFDALLNVLLSSYESDASKTRATLIKAISEIIRVAPESMAVPQISRVVHAHFRDPSRMVRSDVMTLVGTYITSSADVLAAYFGVLLDAVGDEGVSVRKKAVTIFRDLMAKNLLTCQKASVPGSDPADNLSRSVLLLDSDCQQVRALQLLLSRGNDEQEEESVRELIDETLVYSWFAVPANGNQSGAMLRRSLEEDTKRESVRQEVARSGLAIEMHNESFGASGRPELQRVHGSKKRLTFSAAVSDRVAVEGAKVSTEIRVRAAMMVTLADYATVHDLDATWLASTLQRLLALDAGRPKTAKAAAILQIPGEGAWSGQTVCAGMASTLVDSLLTLSARRTSLPHDGDEPSDEAAALYYREFAAIWGSLSALATVDPKFIAKHMHLLAAYLKTDALMLSPLSRLHTLVNATNVIRLGAAAAAPFLPKTVLLDLQEDLHGLIRDSALPEVMHGAAFALKALLVAHPTLDYDGAAAATKCLRFLERTKDACERRIAAATAHKPEHLWMMQLPLIQQANHDDTAGPGQVQRALLSLGLLGQCFLDVSMPGASLSGIKRARSDLTTDVAGLEPTVSTAEKRRRLSGLSPLEPKHTVGAAADTTEVHDHHMTTLESAAAVVASFARAALFNASTAVSLARKSATRSKSGASPGAEVATAVPAATLNAIRIFERVATFALRSLACIFLRHAGTAMSVNMRDIITTALSHVLPSIRETALLVLEELIHGQEAIQRSGALSLPEADAAILTGIIQEAFEIIRARTADGAQEDDASGIFGDEPSMHPPVGLPPGGTRVRCAAVNLMSEIVRNGILDPDSCTPPIIAATTDAEMCIADKARQALALLCSRYQSRVESKLIQGVCDSYTYQRCIFGTAAARVEDASGDVVSVLRTFYTTAVAHSMRTRISFLKSMVQRVLADSAAGDDNKVIGSNIFQDLQLKRYLCQTLMFLPYAAEDEVLAVIAAINRACTVHAEVTLRVLSPLMETADVTIVDTNPLTIQRTCNVAWCLIFLLSVKRFLRKYFDIRDARISSFDLSASVSKLQERAVSADAAVAASELAVLPVSPDFHDGSSSEPAVSRSSLSMCTEQLAALLSDPALVHDLGGSTLSLPASLRRQVSRSASKPAAAKPKASSSKKGTQKKSRRRKRADSSDDDAGDEAESASEAEDVIRAADVDSGEETPPTTPQRRR